MRKNYFGSSSSKGSNEPIVKRVSDEIVVEMYGNKPYVVLRTESGRPSRSISLALVDRINENRDAIDKVIASSGNEAVAASSTVLSNAEKKLLKKLLG